MDNSKLLKFRVIESTSEEIENPTYELMKGI